MNPSLLAALAAFLVVVLCWRGRGRAALPLVRNDDASAVAALNRAQIALVKSGGARAGQPGAAALDGAPDSGDGGAAIAGPGFGPASGGHGGAAAALAALALPPTHDSHRQRLYRLELQRGFQAGGRARLESIRQARRWSHRSILPLLRQGLRVTDPLVVQEAAAALERFRGRSPGPAQMPPVRPRRVARTR